MSIQNFLKAQRGDPDWTFTPEQYYEKEFKIVNASELELSAWQSEAIVLRQAPTEKELLAKKIQIEVKENANLDIVIINEASDKTQQVFMYNIVVRDSGKFNLGLFVKGGTLNKHIINVTLENYTFFNVYGHIKNSVGGDCEIISKISHQGAYSNSHQFFTCEAGADSQTVFQGLTHIYKPCEFSIAGIEINNLVTDKGGLCHSVPEIFNHCDTTKISMGTATDFIDKERLYYLETRGMSTVKSKNLMVKSHRNKTISIIPDEELRQEVELLFD